MAPKNGYHINDNDESQPCNATKRKCKFGGESGKENHYATPEEAEAEVQKRLKKKHNDHVKLSKKNKDPKFLQMQKDLENVVTLYDYTTDDSMSSSTRGNLLAFEAMKRSGDLELGSLSESNSSYYSGPTANLSGEQREELRYLTRNYPVGSKNPMNGSSERPPAVSEFLKKGYKLDYVNGSLEHDYADVFNGTFAPSKNEGFINARAVLTNPDGEKMVVPVSSPEGYGYNGELVRETLKIAEELNGGSLKSRDIYAYEDLREQEREFSRMVEDTNRHREENYYAEQARYESDRDRYDEETLFGSNEDEAPDYDRDRHDPETLFGPNYE